MTQPLLNQLQMVIVLLGCAVIATCQDQGAASTDAPSQDAMRALVAAASQRAQPWDGPRSGPAGTPGKTIAIISEDLRNGGILGVAQGVREAAKAMDWNIRIFDISGTAAGVEQATSDALASHPDGLIVIGADAAMLRPQLLPFAKNGIPIVGWHVSPHAGKMTDSPIAINVSTDPLEVARITAMAAIVSSDERIGVVIFTDSRFEIAQAKANAMAAIIRSCQERCAFLEMQDVAISCSAELMPATTRELLARHGKAWTHALAINDISFDYAVPELVRMGTTDTSLRLYSAGDGSQSAFMRIQAGIFQVATVAEPLNLHGWQLVDELNRLLAHQPVSGYIVPVHLVTPDNITSDGGSRLLYDPDNGYRDIYRHIWGR